MSWTLTASGHTADADAEAALIETLRTAVREAGASSARMSTQHNGGSIDLLADDGDV